MSIPLRACRPHLTAAQGSGKSRSAFPQIKLSRALSQMERVAVPFAADFNARLAKF